jgi:hypothetical protein
LRSRNHAISLRGPFIKRRHSQPLGRVTWPSLFL